MVLRWFSGGQERGIEAVAILDKLLNDIKGDQHLSSLEKVLTSYRSELKEGKSSVPYILSRLSMDISTVIRKEDLILSPVQEKDMAELREVLNIRYGY